MSNFSGAVPSDLKYRLQRVGTIAAFAALSVIVATDAHAYIGPGAGIGAIGSLFALLGAIFLAIVGFLWYPIKRLMKRKKTAVESKSEPEAEQT